MATSPQGLPAGQSAFHVKRMPTAIARVRRRRKAKQARQATRLNVQRPGRTKKGDAARAASPFMQGLSEPLYFARTSLHSFSKYCLGRAPMTVPVTLPFSKR